MKKVILMILAAITFAAMDARADLGGQCGEHLNWTYTSSDSTLTITGTGAMVDYEYSNNYNYVNTPWWNFKEQIRTVSLPDGLTNIGDGAFFGCTGLTSVAIPNSVTSIGLGVFWYCNGLTSVTIPNSVTRIGERAFESCSSLISITIPNSVTSIESSAFSQCSRLTSITIPNSVTSILHAAFWYCTGLTSVTINSTIVGERMFEGCSSLTSVTISDSVTSIGSQAFIGCSSLTSVTIPNSVTSIGERAFFDCSGLTSVTCEAILPPSLDSTVFCRYISDYDVSYALEIPLYVPVSSVETYKNTGVWNWFKEILPIEFSVAGVSLNTTALNLTVGNSQNLIATITPSDATNQTVSWTSNNPSVASVDASGNVTAISAGTATITVTTADGNKTADCMVTVTSSTPSQVPVTGVSLDTTVLNLTVGNSQNLTATITPSDATNQTILWTSNNPSVASVDTSGNVTAISVGTATIIVITEDGNKTASCVVTVTASTPSQIPVTGVVLNSLTLNLSIGDEVYLTPTITPSNATNQTVVWISNYPDVVSVDASGKVTAVSAGASVVTVITVDGNKTASCAVRVTDPTANKLINTAKIYSHGGKLYVVLSETENLKIFNLSGTLVKDVTLPSGETAIPLERGVYVVKLGNDRTEKVLIQ